MPQIDKLSPLPQSESNSENHTLPQFDQHPPRRFTAQNFIVVGLFATLVIATLGVLTYFLINQPSAKQPTNNPKSQPVSWFKQAFTEYAVTSMVMSYSHPSSAILVEDKQSTNSLDAISDDLTIRYPTGLVNQATIIDESRKCLVYFRDNTIWRKELLGDRQEILATVNPDHLAKQLGDNLGDSLNIAFDAVAKDCTAASALIRSTGASNPGSNTIRIALTIMQDGQVDLMQVSTEVDKPFGYDGRKLCYSMLDNRLGCLQQVSPYNYQSSYYNNLLPDDFDSNQAHGSLSGYIPERDSVIYMPRQGSHQYELIEYRVKKQTYTPISSTHQQHKLSSDRYRVLSIHPTRHIIIYSYESAGSKGDEVYFYALKGKIGQKFNLPLSSYSRAIWLNDNEILIAEVGTPGSENSSNSIYKCTFLSATAECQIFLTDTLLLSEN